MSKIKLIHDSCADPVGGATKQCCRAYKKFIGDYPDYDVDVRVCVYLSADLANAQAEFNRSIGGID